MLTPKLVKPQMTIGEGSGAVVAGIDDADRRSILRPSHVSPMGVRE